MDQPQAPPIDYSRRYTVEEYFAVEEQTGIRHEYYHGEIFPLEGPHAAPEMMAGGSKAHNQLVRNAARHLEDGLPDGPCRVFTENVRTIVAPGRHYLYPDVVVTCADDDERDERTIYAPTIIIEVLSGSTEARDRGWKLEQYLAISSLTQYVLLNQWRMLVESYTREPGRGWLRVAFDAPQDEVPFPALNARIPVGALYQRVKVSPLRLWRNPEQSGG